MQTWPPRINCIAYNLNRPALVTVICHARRHGELGAACTGLDDTQLSESSLPFELHRAQVSDRRVSSFEIVEAFDVVEHIGSRLVPRPVGFVPGALGLQRREEALHRCVVPDIAGSTHRSEGAVEHGWSDGADAL